MSATRASIVSLLRAKRTIKSAHVLRLLPRHVLQLLVDVFGLAIYHRMVAACLLLVELAPKLQQLASVSDETQRFAQDNFASFGDFQQSTIFTAASSSSSEVNRLPLEKNKPEVKKQRKPKVKASTRRFACPLSKQNPYRYEEVHGRACTNKPGLEIEHLVEHLTRVHSVHSKGRCPFCRSPWLEQGDQRFEEVELHYRTCRPSREDRSAQPELMSKAQETECRQPLDNNKTPEQIWALVFMRLFPFVFPIPSPYYDYYVPRHRLRSVDEESLADHAYEIFADASESAPQTASVQPLPLPGEIKQPYVASSALPKAAQAADIDFPSSPLERPAHTLEASLDPSSASAFWGNDLVTDQASPQLFHASNTGIVSSTMTDLEGFLTEDMMDYSQLPPVPDAYFVESDCVAFAKEQDASSPNTAIDQAAMPVFEPNWDCAWDPMDFDNSASDSFTGIDSPIVRLDVGTFPGQLNHNTWNPHFWPNTSGIATAHFPLAGHEFWNTTSANNLNSTDGIDTTPQVQMHEVNQCWRGPEHGLGCNCGRVLEIGDETDDVQHVCP